MTKKIADKNVSFVEEEMFDHALFLLSQSSLITMRLIPAQLLLLDHCKRHDRTDQRQTRRS
jgi:hypothetical protein